MKKQNTILFLFTLLISMVYTKSFAIAVANADGKTIYYNYINNGTELEVSSSNAYSGNIVIPESVTYKGTTYSVTSIGNAAFYNCSGLTSITIPNSVTSIGNAAFDNCSGLTSITIPNSVTSIGDRAFYKCSSLTSITIGSSVTSIGAYAFYECSGLTSLNISDLEAWCKISFYHEFSNPLFYAHHLFMNDQNISNLVIPNSVTNIENYAFYGCSGLTSVTIPDEVTRIGYAAFQNCSSLASVDIGKKVTNICAKAFERTQWFDNQSEGLVYAGNVAYACKGVIPNDIVIKEGTTAIAEYLFYNKQNITTISIPNSVTYIGSYAFDGCRGLTSINIPSNATYIGEFAFQGCTNLESIHISDLFSWCMITFAKDYNGGTSNPFEVLGSRRNIQLFLNGEEVTNLVIPYGVTKLNSYAFQNLKSLSSVTIPNTVTSIGSRAFTGCDNLLTVKSEITEPFNCIIFSENTLRKGTLYIPEGTMGLYTRFDGWREFLKIEEVSGQPLMYRLSFVVDNKELLAQNVETGTAITPPAKDGDGNAITWYTYPSTMPAHDLVVYGMVVKPTSAKYTLSYILDGKQYKQETIEEGAMVAKETEPSKEGYTFSGWQNEPTTMPGRNVTVNGNFTINSYRLSFIAENRELSAKNQQYGSAITAPATDGEGNAITWYTYPSTMPAHDLVVYGMVVKQAEPEVFVWLTVKDGQGTTKVRVKQGTEQVLAITPEEGWKLLTVTMDGQDVTAQLKDGGTLTTPAIMQDATIAVVYEQEVSSEVAAARQSKAIVKVVDDGVVISNAEADTRCTVYASSGQQVVSTVIDGGSRKIALPKGQVYVLTLGTRTLKFSL